ncbi:MAG: hypothetical protein JWR50_3408 [Mucilaginibacter sp.]|nr:hypothetical protein [Mucilaginibacter sp.]
MKKNVNKEKCFKNDCIVQKKLFDPTITLDDNYCFVNKDLNEYLIKITLNGFKNINLILLSAGSLASFVIVSKALNIKDFKWGDLKIPINNLWIILTGFTFAHIFVGLGLLKTLSKIKEMKCNKIRRDVFMAVTSSENIIISGLNTKPVLGSYLQKTFYT